MDPNTLKVALENVLGIFFLVIAYKIYHSNCHTFKKNKFFKMEVSENIPREISLNTTQL
jgi:hypothetical protein